MKLPKKYRKLYDDLLRRFGSRQYAEEKVIEEMQDEQDTDLLINKQCTDAERRLATLDGKEGKGE